MRNILQYAALVSVALLTLTACSGGGRVFGTQNASGYVADEAEQCVPFARRESGIALYGDAHSWWRKADGKYLRSNAPAAGSVLVLKRTPKLQRGHVAVVKDIIDARRINVTHSNWGNDRQSRRVVYTAQLAEDASAAGDWSSVRFWNKEVGNFGFPYPAYGFIYPSPYTAAKIAPEKKQSIWSFVDGLLGTRSE